jgi:uncharacterized coiled-coil protein SlyX
MNRNILHKQLAQRLEDLVERHQELQQHDATVPHVEINDFLSEIRTVYELALSLHHTNAISSMEMLELTVAERFNGMPPEPEKIEEVKKPFSPPQTTEELLVNTINHAIAGQQEHTAKTHAEIHDLFEPTESIANQFHESVTLAEVVADKAAESRIAETLKHAPIADLQHAIGINERFYYIQHLFNGNAGGFHLSIEKLNELKTNDAAMNYIKSELAPKHSWDFSSQAVRNFLELIERRYIA